MVEVKGEVKKPFEGVKKAFRENFERRNEVGADFCVYYENEPVVDIWGGYKDEEKENEWDQDTLVPVFSTTKAVSAACLALLNSRGLLDYDEKVSTYWPEFGQNGKEDVTVNQLLQHRAGLSAIDRKLTPEIIANHEKLDEILARQEPGWEPGKRQGYHVWTIGWYMSALLSRVDPEGRRLGEFVREEINEEVDTEFYIGIDDDFDMERIATLIPLSKIKGIFAMPLKFVKEFFKPWSLTFKSMLNPSFVSNHGNFNRREILELEIGSGNGVGNARSLAKIMDGLVDEDSPIHLDENTLAVITDYPEEPPGGYEDRVFMQDIFRFHRGFMKPSSEHSFAGNRKAFGGFGAGGSFVIVDPENELTMAYTMNRMSAKMANGEREIALRNSVYNSLE